MKRICCIAVASAIIGLAGNSATRAELNEGAHHDHLVCLQCGRVEEFYDPEIEKRQNEITRQRGFELHGHSLALYADCTKKDCPFRSS